MNKRSTQTLRKRKLYLVLPLLALPFVTLAFWAMGGGKGRSEATKASAGLNLQLPDAKLKDEKNFDKLSFYNEAEKDSLKNEEALQNDPAYKSVQDTSVKVMQLITKNDAGYTPENNGLITSPFSDKASDSKEQKIYKKISELNKQINTPYETTLSEERNSGEKKRTVNEQFSSQVDKLQNMMQTMSDKQESDPEMEQVDGMLDKILAIQHPEKIKDQVRERSIKNKLAVFSVLRTEKNNDSTILRSHKDTTKRKPGHTNFYDLSNTLTEELQEGHAIEAVIQETQTVVSGAVVKFRLTNDVYINGILIPKGNFVYGNASLANERLSLTINTIRYQNNLLPVSLAVYDMDGIAGIYIPGSISREAAKESGEQSLQNIELTTLNPSIAVQAASTGIQAAKSLLAKKVKLIKVTLKAGYRVLLKDNNKNNN